MAAGAACARMPGQSSIIEPDASEQGSCWFVYLLPLADCSAFKVGFSCNPIQRIYTFAHRYFERFDLHQAQLLRVRSDDEARAIEAALKSTFAQWRAECPSWVAQDAGGHTEWFSAVYFADARERLRQFRSEHAGAQLLTAHQFIHEELRRLTGTFESWAWSQAHQVSSAPPPAAAESSRVLRDWLDAYRVLEIPLFVDDPAVRTFVERSCGYSP
jgi:hypothetical protein